MKNVRKSVVEALTALEKSQGYSNLILDLLLKKEELSTSDRAFASRLLYGVIERKITLDFYIGKLSAKPVKKLSPIVLNSLRIGIYQLEFMDRIPENAAVNESVNIVKSSPERGASGLVNAVLRSFIRNKPALPSDNSIYALSVRYSCPGWFISELSDYIGKDSAIKFLEDSLLPPPVYLRVNNTITNEAQLLSALTDREFAIESKGNNCLSSVGFGGIDSVKEFNEGHFHIQDISSQICISALDPQSGDRVLDICSAPGGKSCTAAELMENKGEIISCDLHSHRVKLIENNAERLGLNIINAMVNDATVYNPKLGKFDKILCDVPCSGYGVIRRKPEIKFKSQGDLTNLSELQYNILDISSKYLEDNGTLVYSTCTLRREENEDVVNRFLESHPQYIACEVFSKYYCGCGHRLTPYNSGGDGFFFAVLKRK